MIANFSDLPAEDIAQLTDAIPYITILIAGADGKIDGEELEWAEKVAKVRQFDHPNDLTSFYQAVGQKYSDRLGELLIELPGDVVSRNKAIESKLTALNGILAKLESHHANDLIGSFKSFSKHVAQASGGIFGFGSISREEARVMDLDMLNPIQGKL